MKQAMRLALQLVTVGYAVVLVVATHVPHVDVSFAAGTPVPPDKLLHFAAYGVLGLLVGLIAAQTRHSRRRTFPFALAAIAVFALLDETTQPMFGRAAEPFDWVADVAGAVAGLTAAASVGAAVHRLKTSRHGRLKPRWLGTSRGRQPASTRLR